MGKWRPLGKISWLTVVSGVVLLAMSVATGYGKEYYTCGAGATCGTGWATGSDSNNCTSKTSACLTITGGIAKLASNDTLIIGNGTYTQQIRYTPSGSGGNYTTVRAENDWGVLIDGSGWNDNYVNGIHLNSVSYVLVRGIRVKMAQKNLTNQGVQVVGSDHIKVIRCSSSYGPADENAASFDIGPSSSYVLIEECYAYGGTRYMFLVYWSDHVVIRRSVARNDYWAGSLQCAGFVNYDSVNTVWQNNIAIDSDTKYCSGGYYGGFWSENKSDHADDTSQVLYGNIVLNIRTSTYAAGQSDYKISGTRTINHHVLWDSDSGYLADQGVGDPAILNANNLTIGDTSGTFDEFNGQAADGTGVSITGNITNSVKNSIFWNNHSYGIAGYVNSDYNAFYGNGANAGGSSTPAIGSHSKSNLNPATSGLLYLPRIESGSALKSAGESGTQMGAEIVYKMGTDGTLYGENGWNTLTQSVLWPFPNEAQIKADMGAYSGSGAPGVRGFCSGNSLDGSAQSLTKYIWEYLGNKCPQGICSTSGVTVTPPVNVRIVQ